jgi:hypothetical protein
MENFFKEHNQNKIISFFKFWKILAERKYFEKKSDQEKFIRMSVPIQDFNLLKLFDFCQKWKTKSLALKEKKQFSNNKVTLNLTELQIQESN